MPVGPIHEALHTSGNYRKPAHATAIGKTDDHNISLDRIDGMPDAGTKAKIYKAYQNTWWEFEPGEELPDHETRFNDFLSKQKNVTTIVARDEKSGEGVGLLYAYDNPKDHPLETEKNSRLAGIAVSENMQKQGIGTRLVQAHNDIFSARGHKDVVLAYDEPGEKLYKRFSMKPTPEMRVKVKNIRPRSEPFPEANIRIADLRVKRDAATVFAFEKSVPRYATSHVSVDDAARFWMEQTDPKAWIAEHPQDKHAEGAALAAEWRYPVAQTWTPQYLKMMTVPGLRTGTLDRSSGDIHAISDGRRDSIADALLDKALTHARTHEFTNVRIADRTDVEHILQSRGFTQAPVLSHTLQQTAPLNHLARLSLTDPDSI